MFFDYFTYNKIYFNQFFWILQNKKAKINKQVNVGSGGKSNRFQPNSVFGVWADGEEEEGRARKAHS